ncbi:MAG TPA: AAA family ATPase [Gemmataceae bacterium]|jgi:DNA repair exonuclease SbcCD ATPase subunit|nr:AAA family ATPase [Gemmataceae bacterium]
MILRGIHLEHWCCIAKLDLEDLSAGVVVLHGPNRTGKSSLLKAVRGCLYDFDHDSSKAELKSCFPWNGAGPPKVAVEFETGGAVYRLTKLFSKKAEGVTQLEKHSGEKFVSIEDAPREAARKARELLGADKSDQGLNQLLWIDQGIVSLPDGKKLDAGLERRLVSVLGVMVTGGDLSFKQAVDKRYEKWFGVRGEHKPTSQVTVLQRQSEQELGRLAELEAKRRELEQVIRDLDDCDSALSLAEKALTGAKEEFAELTRERERSVERRQQFQQALRDCEAAEQQLEISRKRLEEYAASRQRWQDAEHAAAQGEAGFQVARQEAERLAAELATQEQALHAARSAEQEHQKSREEVDDRTALLKLVQQLERLDKDLERAGQLREAIESLQEQIHKQPVPDKKILETLRANRDKANELKAQLQAGALTVAVKTEQMESVCVRIDGGHEETLALMHGERRSWPVRQRVAVDFPGVGAIEVGRSQENLDLERAAQQLAKVERDFRETLQSFAEHPDGDCLNRLTERRVQTETAAARLQAFQKEFQQLAPSGVGALERERDKLSEQTRLILQRRPDLLDWRASEDEVLEQYRAFQAKAAALQKTRDDLEKADKQIRQNMKGAEERLQERNEQAIRARTTAKNARDELQRLGDEVTVQAQVKQAGDALDAARQRLEDAELTEDEKTIDRRCQDAEAAVNNRAERCRELQKEQQRHKGRVEGSVGLHAQLVEAESALREVQDALAREKLEADAHKRLHELFGQCRDSQVQRVMGPVAERVLDWARTLGLTEYNEVRFGDRFLPEGLVRRNGHPERLDALEDESYGTVEQLGLLVRLALGGVLARDEPVMAILDDPLAHADASKHRRILDIIRMAAEGNAGWNPPAGRVQILILTCHPDRFDHLPGARQIDLGKLITREA